MDHLVHPIALTYEILHCIFNILYILVGISKNIDKLLQGNCCNLLVYCSISLKLTIYLPLVVFGRHFHSFCPASHVQQGLK